jgi:hypothetical protein
MFTGRWQLCVQVETLSSAVRIIQVGMECRRLALDLITRHKTGKFTGIS